MSRAIVVLVALTACGGPAPTTSALAAVPIQTSIQWISELPQRPAVFGVAVRGVLVELDGRFYGLAGERGPNQGGTDALPCDSPASWNTVDHTKRCPGTLFSVGRAGDLRVEHAVTRLDDTTSNNADGYHPYGSLALGSDGWLYGVTQMGGSPAISGAHGSGVLFRCRNRIFQTLHSFFSQPRAADGMYPMGALAAIPDGSVCGTAKGGGDFGNGSVWCWSAAGFRYAPMPAAAGESTGGVTFTDGALHGVTGSAGANGAGTYFTVDPDTLTVTVVDSFAAFAVNDHGTDNTPIQAPTALGDGTLVVAREFGGQHGTGLVARLGLSGIVALKEFDDIPLAAAPRFSNVTGGMANGAIAEGCDGMIYGTTTYGGSGGAGSVYRIARDGSRFAMLASFPLGGPSYPYGGLVRGSDCALWGTTFVNGRIWRLVPP